MKTIINKAFLLRLTPILFLIFLLFLMIPNYGFTKNDNQKTILYVSSFSENSTWSKECKEALSSTFKQENYSVKLLDLYLDEETTPQLDLRINILKKYFSNLKEKIDIIIVFDYGATNVFLTYSDSNISKIPIVFVSELNSETKFNFNNITGIISDYGLAQTYKLGLKMFPETKKVYVWADKSPTGIFFMENAKNILKGYNDGIEIEYGLDVNNKAELIHKCKNLNPNSFIIFSTWSIDNKGKKYSDEELNPIFLQEIKVPMFCSYDDLIGSGFIGGYVQSAFENGKAAAIKAIRIFNGEFADRMVTEHINPIPIFDLQKIIEEGGNTKVIPNESIIINKYKGYFYLNKILFITIFILIFISSIILVIALIQKRKNKALIKTIIEKDEKEKELEQSVKMLTIAIPSLKILSWSYSERTELFKYGIANENGLLDLNNECDLNYARQFASDEFKEKFDLFFNNIKNIDINYEFQLQYFGRIPQEEFDSWWEIRGMINSIEDKKGKYRVVNAIHINIDKHKQIEERLNNALEKSIRTEKLKSNIISNFTNEIKSPLNTIIGFSSLISKSNEEEERQEYIKVIKENNDNLINIFNNIILLSEIQSGYLEFNLIKFDLKQFFDEIGDIFQHKIKENIDFIIDCPHKSCIVMLDKEKLIQIFKIFIDNAIKFTNEGYIKIGFSVVDNSIMFYCQDSGVGIKKENIEKIFDHFEKADSFQSGTGLGLTIFKSIMDFLDLKYGVESQPDQGSKFWFVTNSKLIIIDDENEKESNVEIDNDIEIKSKILIVDENNPYRKSLKDILDKKYDIVFADNSNEAFEKITIEIPDLIIMSLSIQHIDGYEAIKVIRQDHNEIPIIVISNKALLHEREKAFKAGCNEFLEKPVDNELLFSVIENLINKN